MTTDPEERGAATFPLPAPERVLPTLNADGTRRWIRPVPSPGPFWKRRRAVAVVLMLVFLAIPHLSVGGRPLLLLDLARREFTIFGVPFLASDTLPFMLLFLTLMLAVLIGTALFGRVWCGWACPQTVYLEFLFRPIERWLEGGARGSRRLDAAKQWLHPRRLAKLAIYLAIALVLAHTFLGYFVPMSELATWVRRSPFEHPMPFFLMALVTALVMFDFTWFREQTCLVACPYGRFQSALLDRDSWIVGFDGRRGEPRGKGMPRPPGAGDCVDCGLCVQTCPTGIDIRDGLQMECIHCTQCMDACDAVMRRVGKPPGLIRYGTRAGFAGLVRSGLRPRLILYPAALLLALGGLIVTLATRSDAEITVLRGIGEPFTLDARGDVVNQLRVRISNREPHDRSFTLAVEGVPGARLLPDRAVRVGARRRETANVFVVGPRGAFEDGSANVRLRVANDSDFRATVPCLLLGPRDPAGEAKR